MFEIFREAFISHPLRRLALILLCLPYLVSGIHKMTDFGAGIAEMNAYGLLPPKPYAAATIILQLGCSVMIITGFWRWIAALALAIFTLVASVIATPFWRYSGTDYVAMLQTFSERMALAGALLLVTWYTLHRFKNKGKDDWR